MPPKKSGSVKRKGSKSRRPKAIVDSIDGITRPALSRVLRKAGAVRVTKEAYEHLRGSVKAFTDSFVRIVIEITQHDRHRTVKEAYVQEAVRMLGLDSAVGLALIPSRITKHKIYRSGGSEARRAKPGSVALREIRYYQKNSDTLAFPREAVKRLIREATFEYYPGAKYTKKALILIQAVLETYVLHLGEIAVLLAVHDGERKSVTAADLELAQRIARDRVLGGLEGVYMRHHV